MTAVTPATAIPDTKLVERAHATAGEVLPPAVMAHSLRTFLLACSYAEQKRLAFDREGLAIAALLHDLGLSARLREPAKPFPAVGAAALRELSGAEGMDARRADLLAEAIELHMRWFPRWSRGNEVGLLQVGAWMDVVGLRRSSVPRNVRAAINAMHPRTDFDRQFRRSLFASVRSLRACAIFLP